MAGRAGHHIAAISWHLRKEGLKDLTLDKRIRLALHGLKRLAADRSGKIGGREPFPLEALRCWVETDRRRTSAREFRDPALVAVGIRCMRRPCELAALKRKHVQRTELGLRIFLEKSKTDQLRVGRWLNIDAVRGSRTCPVFLLQQHMDTTPYCEDEHPLFASGGGKPLTVSAISGIVKNMVRAAGLDVQVSGHSLRIAGATQAVKAGWEMAEICAVGGWRSNAVLLYLRDSAVAQKRGSQSMGF